MPAKVSLKSSVAEEKPRDQEGHFIKKSESDPNLSNQSPSSFWSKLFTFSKKPEFKKDDTLIDVRINNPLEKITSLLQDIKKQKAFSFTFKGSLGLAGAVLTLSVFGFLGGGKLLCDKGSQSHLGRFRILSIQEQLIKVPNSSTVFYLINKIKPNSSYHLRTVLIKQDGSILHIEKTQNLASNFTFTPYIEKQVIVTGSFDSCTNTIFLNSDKGIEEY